MPGGEERNSVLANIGSEQHALSVVCARNGREKGGTWIRIVSTQTCKELEPMPLAYSFWQH